MSKGQRVSLVVVVFALVFAAIAGFFYWILEYPPIVSGTLVGARTADVELETVSSVGFGVHPSWVSYLVRNPSGAWVHTSLIRLPAHATIHVTVYEFDTLGPLRNPFWGKVTGTVGDVEYVNGKATKISNSYGPNAPAHTFTVPALGINVPLVGVSDSAANVCSRAPCALSHPHNIITFTFHTGAAGSYRWQCFIPCGAGFLDGNGGPMQTIGYMAGFLYVGSASA